MRYLIFIALVAALFFLIKRFTEQLPKKGNCKKCSGQGYWMGTRGRERCDVCRGTGNV